MRAGARGYIMKREVDQEGGRAIHEVLKGNIYLSKELTELFAQKFISGSAGRVADQPIERPGARSLSLYRQGLRDARDRREVEGQHQDRPNLLHAHQGEAEAQLGCGMLREAMRWNDTSLAR